MTIAGCTALELLQLSAALLCTSVSFGIIIASVSRTSLFARQHKRITQHAEDVSEKVVEMLDVRLNELHNARFSPTLSQQNRKQSIFESKRKKDE